MLSSNGKQSKSLIFGTMQDSITIKRQVDFSETDMAGIVHFSNYLRWVEAAESAFFQALEVPLISSSPENVMGWPRVRVQCDYKAPVMFQDQVEVFLFIRAIKVQAIEYGFKIYRLEGADRTLAAKGMLTTLYVKREPPSAPMKAAAIPQVLSEKIKVYCPHQSKQE